MKLLNCLLLGVPAILFTSCSGGWSVGGYELTPSDTNTVFIEILDSDSTVHWYHGTINESNNWCYAHNAWEDVRVK